MHKMRCNKFPKWPKRKKKKEKHFMKLTLGELKTYKTLKVVVVVQSFDYDWKIVGNLNSWFSFITLNVHVHSATSWIVRKSSEKRKQSEESFWWFEAHQRVSTNFLTNYKSKASSWPLMKMTGLACYLKVLSTVKLKPSIFLGNSKEWKSVFFHSRCELAWKASSEQN